MLSLNPPKKNIYSVELTSVMKYLFENIEATSEKEAIEIAKEIDTEYAHEWEESAQYKVVKCKTTNKQVVVL